MDRPKPWGKEEEFWDELLSSSSDTCGYCGGVVAKGWHSRNVVSPITAHYQCTCLLERGRTLYDQDWQDDFFCAAASFELGMCYYISDRCCLAASVEGLKRWTGGVQWPPLEIIAFACCPDCLADEAKAVGVVTQADCSKCCCKTTSSSCVTTLVVLAKIIGHRAGGRRGDLLKDFAKHYFISLREPPNDRLVF